MEQLQLPVRKIRMARLPQKVRDEVVGRMVEAILLVFKTEREESYDLVSPQDRS